ncbi:MAG: peptidoglycan-binding protein [Clostridia bacterium]|nr:peptidoglycan-binding protein [Clostridia bacterium]
MIEYPVIPENIVIHLGAPGSDAPNVTESFADYIKNVASSEIFPTWPREALIANILAQISVALNRVYTEYYRSAGYDFDITSSIAHDQSYVYQRNIFANISELVDEIFNTYLKRPEFIEPLYATFCDGVEVTCNGLSQWGSVELANQGLDAFEILKRYYGTNLDVVSNVSVESVEGSAPPTSIREGDTGRDVELIQTKLNRISSNYPGIPKIYPTDGFFGESTTAAVRKFQEVFNLEADGVVGKNTWYRIQFIYNAVKRLSALNSEGLRLSDLSTAYPAELSEGDVSAGVLVLQYYLHYIAAFIPSVLDLSVDGSFGAGTRESVISFQKTYGLPETGVVDRAVWDEIEAAYYSYLRSIPYRFTEGAPLPFPGRILRAGIEGDDVLALQRYLNYIGRTYTEIPEIAEDGIFGPSTESALAEFIRIFGIEAVPSRVGAVLWNAIASVYDDLYVGNTAEAGQYSGRVISEE